MQKIIIFGTGLLAQLLYDYIEEDNQFEIAAFTEDDPTTNELYGLPVIDFSTIGDGYSPTKYKILVVIGYSERNQKRKKVFDRVKEKGYSFVNYIHQTSILHKTTTMGENCIILENNVFQPHVSIGDDVCMLSSNVISHHVKIEDHCFVVGHVYIAGKVTMGSGSIIGFNSSVKQCVKIAKKTFVGAGLFLRSDTLENSVYEAPDPKILSPRK